MHITRAPVQGELCSSESTHKSTLLPIPPHRLSGVTRCTSRWRPQTVRWYLETTTVPHGNHSPLSPLRLVSPEHRGHEFSVCTCFRRLSLTTTIDISSDERRICRCDNGTTERLVVSAPAERPVSPDGNGWRLSVAIGSQQASVIPHLCWV